MKPERTKRKRTFGKGVKPQDSPKVILFLDADNKEVRVERSHSRIIISGMDRIDIIELDAVGAKRLAKTLSVWILTGGLPEIEDIK